MARIPTAAPSSSPSTKYDGHAAQKLPAGSAGKATCSGCDKTWGGLKICHCSGFGCHRTFSCEAHFKAHRYGGRCRDPLTLIEPDGSFRYKLNAHGVVVGASNNPRFQEDTE